jgi:hypothetical protein
MAELKLWTHPRDYMGDSFEDYYIGPSMNRDSDILTQSNFAAALEMLGGESKKTRDVIVASFTHWANGWIDAIFVHKDAKEKVEILQDIADRIQNYPVLDEDDYSQRESEAYDDHYKDWGRNEALKVLGLEDQDLTKAQELELWRAWIGAQQGSADDPSTGERTLREEAKRSGLI